MNAKHFQAPGKGVIFLPSPLSSYLKVFLNTSDYQKKINETYEMWYYQYSCEAVALNIKHLNEETLINS